MEKVQIKWRDVGLDVFSLRSNINYSSWGLHEGFEPYVNSFNKIRHVSMVLPTMHHYIYI